jgi:tight adherence protein C
MFKSILILVLWLLSMGGMYWLFTRRSHARVARERVFTTKEEELADSGDERQEPFLTGWLIRAGFRAPGSASAFTLATALCVLAGLVFALLLHYGDPFAPLVARAAKASEGMGTMAQTAAALLPWMVFVYLAIAPWLYVRGKRRQRVLSIDNELPMVLELLATMSEAGLGFDASFSKILSNEKTDSPLVEELKLFQLETLAGVPRVRCFRRLTRRSEVSSMTIFCSAMIQAEQVGAGFSSVLRTQATDLRSRRRERAMIQAQALPVKLVFPLVICFLPGIFVVTLGPAFMEFFKMAGGIIRGA